MPRIEQRYRIDPGPHGTRIITQSGRCSGDQATINAIFADRVLRYEVVPLPAARGVVLKPLDGSVPQIVQLEPPTMNGKRFNVVKVDANVTPFAAVQPGGEYEGVAVMQYEIRWQEVGDI